MAVRFDCAVLESSALPPPPPGALRVLGLALSPGARLVFEASAARWRADAARARGPRGPNSVRLLTPLDNAVVDEATVVRAVHAHLALSKARLRAGAHVLAPPAGAHALTHASAHARAGR